MNSTKSLSLVLMLFSLCFGSALHAQQGGCQGAEFSAFDFWVGEWDVTDNITGNLAGENSIKKMEQGCLLMENWISAGTSGVTGTSLNYYNPNTGKWQQLWVSMGRYSIDISGGIVGGSMVLEGKIYIFSGGVEDFRGTWTPNEDGSVRQFFEQYNRESETWDAWFDGRYMRKS